MNKFNLILFSVLLLSNPIFALQEELRDSLPGLIKRDGKLRPYVKDLVVDASPMEKSLFLEGLESSSSFKALNFRELTKEIYGEKSWVPCSYKFENSKLQSLLHPYSPKLSASDYHMVFLSNALYEVGHKIYDQLKDFTYLEYAASIGHVSAQLKMFFIDFKEGKLEGTKSYLFCSASQGDPEALLTLSEVYQGIWGKGSRDLEIAKLLCEEASKSHNPEAQFRIEVATLTEGLFNSQRDFQKGIRKAKKLEESGNQRAKEFLSSIMKSSGDALQEGNNFITDEDLEFLRTFLKWTDVR